MGISVLILDKEKIEQFQGVAEARLELATFGL
jgi:hypothetical protein